MMNIKYKLIKCYPDSPPLNSVFSKSKEEWYKNKHYDYELSSGMVEGHPEFWEKVEDKDYEILSFKFLNNSWKKQPDGMFKWHVNSVENTEEYLLSQICNGEYKIHSIKRLSDGEVFTCGDKVTVPKHLSMVEIQSIKIDGCNNEINLWYTRRSLISNNGPDNWFEKMNHAKPILFTTEDGVPYYQGDAYYGVCPDLSTFMNSRYVESDANNPFKRFSTREAAEEYINLNKPQFSKQDMIDFTFWNNISTLMEAKKNVNNWLDERNAD